MKRVSAVVAITLKEMRDRAKPGMTTRQLDNLGGEVMKDFGARFAPFISYYFPGWTCISVNREFAHGIPSEGKVLKEGDLVNIDVSAELDGFWSDNGGSFVLDEDIHGHQKLVDTSREILQNAIAYIRSDVKISHLGRLIETEAKKSGYKVFRNLTGHGIGRNLHEEPREIPNYYDRFNLSRFKKNMVVAIETFISTHSTMAFPLKDGWTLVGNKGGYVAQHEHSLIVTDDEPVILTHMNGIWD